MACAGDDEGGAAVWAGRTGGQSGVGSSVPDLQPQFASRNHPADCEHAAAPALPHHFHHPAGGQHGLTETI